MRGLVLALCACLGLSVEAQEANNSAPPKSVHASGSATTSRPKAASVEAAPAVVAASNPAPSVERTPPPAPVVAVAPPAAPPVVLVSAPAVPPSLIAAPQAAPVSVQPAAGAPAPAAAEPRFSPLVVADLITGVCAASESQRDGVTALASSQGLGTPADPPPSLKRVLPDSARAWAVPAVEASVYLFAFGEEPLRCGAGIVRALPEVTAQRIAEQLGKAPQAFKVEKTEALSEVTRFTRLKSATGRFIDIMEYGASGSDPTVLRVDLLPPD